MKILEEQSFIDVLSLPVRAENIEKDTITEMAKNVPYTFQSLVTYLTEFFVGSFSPRIFLLGLKGSGKSLATILAYTILENRERNYDARIEHITMRTTGEHWFANSASDHNLQYSRRIEYVYFEKSQHELIEYPSKDNLLDISKLGDRLERCDGIIIDDVHYICEYAIQRKSEGKPIIAALSGLVETCQTLNKRILLVSEEPLLFYAMRLRDKNFDKMCHRLGQFARFAESNCEEIEYGSMREMPYLDPSAYMTWLAWLGVTCDFPSALVLLGLSRLPRQTLYVLQSIASMEITIEKLVETAKRLLYQQGKTSLMAKLDNEDIFYGVSVESIKKKELPFKFTLSHHLVKMMGEDDPLMSNQSVKEFLEGLAHDLVDEEPTLLVDKLKRHNSWAQVLNRAFTVYGYSGVLKRISPQARAELHAIADELPIRIYRDNLKSIEKELGLTRRRCEGYADGVLIEPFKEAFDTTSIFVKRQ